MVQATLTRDNTGRVNGTATVTAPGDGNPIGIAFVGEDVSAELTYEDDAGSGVDPAAAPTVTITHVPSDTDVVSSASATSVSTGNYEYDWDTAASANGTGEYQVEATAEFSSETKIVRATVELQ